MWDTPFAIDVTMADKVPSISSLITHLNISNCNEISYGYISDIARQYSEPKKLKRSVYEYKQYVLKPCINT